MKKMFVVQGTNIAKVTILKETDKTYWIENKQSIGGYVSVYSGARVRKSETSLQWFDNPKDAFACLIVNQEQEIANLEKELSDMQDRLHDKKETLVSWKQQYVEKHSAEEEQEQS